VYFFVYYRSRERGRDTAFMRGVQRWLVLHRKIQQFGMKHAGKQVSSQESPVGRVDPDPK